MRVWPGAPYPLGATWDGEGVNFAIFSDFAEAVELCLFDAPGSGQESARVFLSERTSSVWHGYLPDVRPGQLYGYRVHGRYAPEEGHRFNANKLLLDPYAKAITGRVEWNDTLFGYRVGDPAADASFSDENSAGRMPKSVIVDPAFTWGDDRAPRTPWSRTVIYECHVKGLTQRHPGVPERLRGTYLGLASDAVVEHLLAIGVTAVELLPIHHFAIDRHLVERGLTNYWGYNTIGYFAPDVRYATHGTGEQIAEFKSMVKALHRAGIEVILDVVYNHTAEGNHLGPTLSFRGIDNASYYRLAPGDPRHYANYTGCGNTLNVYHSRVMQLVLDSLRYWVEEMHVDGFRFDLAVTLGRERVDFNTFGRFFATVRQDPALANVKLIAEPWDLGPGGFHLGGFPPEWAEWNALHRDAVRGFWRGDEDRVADLASRLSGSSDLFAISGRGPHASINFVACHDGFTLHDLVTYAHKHNEGNLDGNTDGHDDNLSNNWGVEGETESEPVRRLRMQMKKNLLATLAFSQGVPMISHGDEIGRTQGGNNNAYCQDNETAWVDWTEAEEKRELRRFVERVFALRRANPVFRRRRFFAGDPITHHGVKDIAWLRPDGREMTDEDWNNASNHVLGMLVHGDASDELDERGRPNRGETLLLMFNGGERPRYFELPALPEPGTWVELVNTARPEAGPVQSSGVNLVGHSLLLLGYEAPR